MSQRRRMIALVTVFAFFTQTVTGCSTIRSDGSESAPPLYTHQAGLVVGNHVKIKTHDGQTQVIVLTQINEDSYEGYIKTTDEYRQIAFSEIESAAKTHPNSGLITLGVIVITIWAVIFTIESFFKSAADSM